MPTTGSPSGRRRTAAASEKPGPVARGSAEEGRPSAGKTPSEKTGVKKAAVKKSVKKAAGGKPVKKAAGRKPAKKTAVKKSAVKKAAVKKSVKKSAVKKAAVKKPAKKTAVKKSAVKKAAGKKPAKKTAVKKSVAKKAAGKKAVKKAAVKKAVKKAAPRKSATKESRRHKPTTITRRVSRKRPNRRGVAAKSLIGWREWVVLPEFTATPIKAKVDSGAVTSSLHAFNLQISTDGGQTTARFGVAPKQGSHAAKTIVEHPVVAFKKVRSSNGQAELRPVIRTLAQIGEETFEIDITLASRDAMGFRMLLGRRAVRNRFVIDPGRSFLQPTAPDVGPPTDQ